MRKLLMSFVCVMSIGLLGPKASAEMRGLWVDAFHQGFRSPSETSAMVAKAKECNFNTLFVQVRKRGDVYYKSSIEPMAADVQEGYDPLADVLKKAHAAGLKVHAWIIVYEVFHDVEENQPNPAQVHLRHPEWIMRDDQGRTTLPGDKVFLDPGLPEVQDYVTDLVEEIVGRYAVDGIHLDGISYPSQQSGYNEDSVARFNKSTRRDGTPMAGDKAWCNWRRSQVTELVRAAHSKIADNPRKIPLSAAVKVSGAEANRLFLQDWQGWLRTKTIDFVVPMVFTDSSGLFKQMGNRMLSSDARDSIILGQAGYRLGSAASIEQVRAARDLGAGVVIYSYACCSVPRQGERVSLMDELKSGLYAEPDPILP